MLCTVLKGTLRSASPAIIEGTILSRQESIENSLYVRRLKAWTTDLTLTCPPPATLLKEERGQHIRQLKADVRHMRMLCDRVSS